MNCTLQLFYVLFSGNFLNKQNRSSSNLNFFGVFLMRIGSIDYDQIIKKNNKNIRIKEEDDKNKKKIVS